MGIIRENSFTNQRTENHESIYFKNIIINTCADC
jgi:hypothetical protein